MSQLFDLIPKTIINYPVYLIIAILIPGLLTLSAHADNTFEAQGVYVKTAEGYVLAKPIPGLSGLSYDFGKYLMDMPEVKGENLTLDIVFYKPDFNPNWVQVELRNIETTGAGIPLTPTQTKTLGKDLFQLSYSLNARKQHFLAIDTACCSTNIYAVSLTNTKSAIKSIFSDPSLNPISAEYTLSAIAQGAPEDEDLKSLLGEFKHRVMQKHASDLFQYLEATWKSAQEEKLAADRFENLTHVKGLCERYIAEYPQGEDLKRVKKYLELANKKLAI